MANFYDEVNICEHQYSRIVNAVNEDNLLLEDEVRASLPLLGEVDESATFCVRCRAIPNAVTVGHENELQNPAADWGRRSPFSGHDNSRHLVVNGAVITPTTQYLITAPGDGADMPLLNDSEGFGGGLSMNRIGIEETEHCHAAVSLGSRHNSGAWHQLLAATVMCLLFMVAEVVGGYLAGSLAVMTDAAHLLSDFVGFLVSLFAVWIGRKAPTQKLSFGYHRAEILGALFSIAIIWIMTGVFVCLAVLRVVHQDFVIEADTMMIVAAIGVVINIIMGLVLHGVCLGLRGHHHHGHSHSATVSAAEHHQNKPHQNINVRAAVIHVLGDLIQSVGVLVSAIVIKFYPNAKLVDPVCTFLFSLLVLSTTVPVLKDAAHVLMEGFPTGFNYTAIVTHLTSLDGVRAVHNLHVWSLTLNKHALSAHLAIDRSADSDAVLRQALYLVKRKYDIHHVTIQVERYCASTMQDCLHCQAPKD